MPQRDLDPYGYHEKPGMGEMGRPSSDKGYHLIESKDITLKLSPETSGFIGELSKKPLAELIKEYEESTRNNPFSESSLDKDRTGFVGVNLSGGYLLASLGIRAGFLKNASDEAFIVCHSASIGPSVGFRLLEFNPNVQGGIPQESGWQDEQAGWNIAGSSGFGLNLSFDNEGKGEMSVILGREAGFTYGYERCYVHRFDSERGK